MATYQSLLWLSPLRSPSSTALLRTRIRTKDGVVNCPSALACWKKGMPFQEQLIQKKKKKQGKQQRKQTNQKKDVDSENTPNTFLITAVFYWRLQRCQYSTWKHNDQKEVSWCDFVFYYFIGFFYLYLSSNPYSTLTPSNPEHYIGEKVRGERGEDLFQPTK